MLARRFLILFSLLFGFCDPASAQSATPAELISHFRLQHREGQHGNGKFVRRSRALSKPVHLAVAWWICARARTSQGSAIARKGERRAEIVGTDGLKFGALKPL